MEKENSSSNTFKDLLDEVKKYNKIDLVVQALQTKFSKNSKDSLENIEDIFNEIKTSLTGMMGGGRPGGRDDIIDVQDTSKPSSIKLIAESLASAIKQSLSSLFKITTGMGQSNTMSLPQANRIEPNYYKPINQPILPNRIDPELNLNSYKPPSFTAVERDPSLNLNSYQPSSFTSGGLREPSIGGLNKKTFESANVIDSPSEKLAEESKKQTKLFDSLLDTTEESLNQLKTISKSLVGDIPPTRGSEKQQAASSQQAAVSAEDNSGLGINLDMPDRKSAEPKKPSRARQMAGKAGAVGKGIGKSLIKKIPIIGAAAGLGFGAYRLMQGDTAGAAMEVASGVAGSIPGVGTAASVGIDAALAARDAKAEESVEQTPAAATTPATTPAAPATAQAATTPVTTSATTPAAPATAQAATPPVTTSATTPAAAPATAQAATPPVTTSAAAPEQKQAAVSKPSKPKEEKAKVEKKAKQSTVEQDENLQKLEIAQGELQGLYRDMRDEKAKTSESLIRDKKRFPEGIIDDPSDPEYPKELKDIDNKYGKLIEAKKKEIERLSKAPGIKEAKARAAAEDERFFSVDEDVEEKAPAKSKSMVTGETVDTSYTETTTGGGSETTKRVLSADAQKAEKELEDLNKRQTNEKVEAFKKLEARGLSRRERMSAPEIKELEAKHSAERATVSKRIDEGTSFEVSKISGENAAMRDQMSAGGSTQPIVSNNVSSTSTNNFVPMKADPRPTHRGSALDRYTERVSAF